MAPEVRSSPSYRVTGALLIAVALGVLGGCERTEKKPASLDTSVMTTHIPAPQEDATAAAAASASPPPAGAAASGASPSGTLDRKLPERKRMEEARLRENMAHERSAIEFRTAQRDRRELEKLQAELQQRSAGAPKSRDMGGGQVAVEREQLQQRQRELQVDLARREAEARSARVPPSVAASGPSSVGSVPSEAERRATAALQEYSVQVSATESMKLNREPGQLSIWIGRQGQAPAAETGMATAESTLGHGNTALVTPFAPDFTIEPSTTKCQLLDPSGTQVLYALKPRARGQYKVGANVSLFASADCSGPPVPKATKVIQVSVSVGLMDGVEDGALQLASATWEKLVTFWGAVLAAVFGAILFRFRKKLAGWSGVPNDN